MHLPTLPWKGIFLFAAALFSAARAPATDPVNSQINAVTVYADRAVVTRTTDVDLPVGTSELVFANLPQSIDEHSLQVSGQGTAQAVILDVSARQTFVNFTPNIRVKELEDALHALQRQVRGLNDRGGILQQQSAMLERMEAALFAPPTKDVARPDLTQLTNSLTYLSDQKARIVTERATLDDQREDLQNKISTAQNQLNEIRGEPGRAYKTVTVRVSAPQAGRLNLALSYTVPGASWRPSYDARVASTARTVALGYFGMVRQSTGEDWNNVLLTLSTARPNLGGSAPALSPWMLDIFAAQRERRDEAALKDLMEKRGNAALASKVATGAMFNAPAPAVEASLAQAILATEATSASFKIELPSSVPSDNSPQRVPITTLSLKDVPEYATTPKQLAAAFLTAKVTNTSEFPLLSGAMNVFLDGTFVASSGLRTVMAGEKFELALGADEGISVKHKAVNKFTENTGFTNSGKRITYEYLITIQNNKRTSEHILVSDQIPVSRNEKIVVKQYTPEAEAVKPGDDGVLTWTLDLKPGEKREIPVKFAVEYGNETVVAGL